MFGPLSAYHSTHEWRGTQRKICVQLMTRHHFKATVGFSETFGSSSDSHISKLWRVNLRLKTADMNMHAVRRNDTKTGLFVMHPSMPEVCEIICTHSGAYHFGTHKGKCSLVMRCYHSNSKVLLIVLSWQSDLIDGI